MASYQDVNAHISYNGNIKMAGTFALPTLPNITDPPVDDEGSGMYQGQQYNWNSVSGAWEPAGGIQPSAKTISFSADGATYSFSTQNDFTPAAIAVQVLPASQDAQLYLKYTITPSEITLICDVCPPAGTDNVSFSITKTA